MKVNSKLMGFAAGTKILMADGSEKAIEKIQTGDKVLSFDQLDAFGILEPKRVLNTFMRVDRNPLKVTVNDSSIELTVAPGQLFIDPGHDWKEATKINEIIDSKGNIHSFEVSQITRGKHQMFDIIVEDNHSLIANGVRVHNMIYSIADVIAGRNLADSNVLSGPLSSYGDDATNTNYSYSSGSSKKKKGKRKKTYTPEVRVDGIVTSSRYIVSIESLVDSLSEIVEETTPTNLTSIKLAIQSSADSIVNYLANFTASIVNATMSAYDKSEVLVMAADMSAAASAMRKPFEDTVVIASGKNIAVNQLNVIQLLILRTKNRMELYTETPKEEVASQLSSSKKAFKSSRAVNGKYNIASNPNAYRSEGGGSRGGGNSGAKTGPSRSSGGGINNGGGGKNTPSQATRAPAKQGPSYSKSQAKSIADSRNIGGLSSKAPSGRNGSGTGPGGMFGGRQTSSKTNSGNSKTTST